MSQCLYCNQPCEETAVFCENCRASLLIKYLPQLGNLPAQVDPIKQAQVNYRYQKAYLQNITALEPFPDAKVSPQVISIPESEQEVDLSQFRPDDWPELEGIEES